jgi:hypothetical protein
MLSPTPVAVDVPGWWRHGPSAAFVLAELRTDDAIYYRDFPSPRATIERIAATDTSTNVPGFTGVRFLFAATAQAEGAPEANETVALPQALAAIRDPEAYTIVGRVPVPPGVDAGRDGSAAEIGLQNATMPDGSPAHHWSVTVLPLNDWGEVGPAVAGTIRRDQTGPFVSVVAPFTSPIWPVPASLAGTAEPGSTVEVGGIGPIELDRRGRFSFETSLAPWPQTLRVTATDAAGNTTTSEVSVVGGVDYRAFPWPTILVIALLVAVVASGIIGSRRQRGVTRVVDLAVRAIDDEGPGPEMEELPPGSGLGTTR